MQYIFIYYHVHLKIATRDINSEVRGLSLLTACTRNLWVTTSSHMYLDFILPINHTPLIKMDVMIDANMQLDPHRVSEPFRQE